MEEYLNKGADNIPATVLDIIRQCWDRNPTVRPTASSLVLLLSHCNREQQLLEHQQMSNMLLQLAEDKVKGSLTFALFFSLKIKNVFRSGTNSCYKNNEMNW